MINLNPIPGFRISWHLLTVHTLNLPSASTLSNSQLQDSPSDTSELQGELRTNFDKVCRGQVQLKDSVDKVHQEQCILKSTLVVAQVQGELKQGQHDIQLNIGLAIRDVDMNSRQQSLLRMEVIEVHCKGDAVLDCSIRTLEQSATVSQVQQDIQDTLGAVNTTVDRVEGRLELVGADQVNATDKSKQAIMKELSVIAGALEERIQSVGDATERVGATIKE